MNFDSFGENIAELSSKTLFTLSGTRVTPISIIIFFIVISFSVLLSFLLQRALKKAFSRRFAKREGTFAAILRLVHYSVVIIGFGIGLQTVGINISALFAAGAVFAIAIGFAMQNIVQNFVSGIILLVVEP